MFSIIHQNTLLTVFLKDSIYNPLIPHKEIANLLLNLNFKNHQELVYKSQGYPSKSNLKVFNCDKIVFDQKQFLLYTDTATLLNSRDSVSGIFAFTDPPQGLRNTDLPADLSVIVGGSALSKTGLKKWLKICNQLHINFFDLKKRGAFVLRSG
jgi:hypothetical protein